MAEDKTYQEDAVFETEPAAEFEITHNGSIATDQVDMSDSTSNDAQDLEYTPNPEHPSAAAFDGKYDGEVAGYLHHEIYPNGSVATTEVYPKDNMPDYVSRMVAEDAELMNRIESLSKFIDDHPANKECEDGIVITDFEYDWMVAQYINMTAYANALQNRLNAAGYPTYIVSPDQLTPETEED